MSQNPQAEPRNIPRWTQIMPGLWYGDCLPTPDPHELEVAVRISRLAEITRQTHRFSSWRHRPELQEAYMYAYLYASGMADKPFLTLVGPTGTGKTHLAMAIAWSFLETGQGTVCYWQVEDLLDALRATFSKDDEASQKAYDLTWSFVTGAHLTLLDDLGLQQPTAWAQAKLDSILDTRYINQRQTVVTTNLTPDMLSPRIADRLRDGKVFTLAAPSFRGVQGKEA